MVVRDLDLGVLRSNPDARTVATRWRALSGGPAVRDPDRRTLVACSGGADSTALALALAAATPALAIGHVVHDLRRPEQTLVERDRVRDLADRLGLEFVEAEVAVRDLPGNAEANARRARYRELERLAHHTGCPFVATAHQANDQVETMLMAMLRGAGPRGLSGIPPRRRLGVRGIRLLRPMLGLDRADAEALCGLVGQEWADDPSNTDLSRLRAAIRLGTATELTRLRPGAPARIEETAANLRSAALVIDGLAASVVKLATRRQGALVWPRDQLRATAPFVLGAALRRAHAELHAGRHADRLPGRSVRQAAAAILAPDKQPRRFIWHACRLLVDAEEVVLQRDEQ